MKVTILYQYYQDLDAPGHSLVQELAQYLARSGDDVTVVSGETGYMQRHASAVSWYRRIIRREQDGPVKVVRTFAYSELHGSYWGRLLSFLTFSLSSMIGLLSGPRPDVVLASSPPIFPVFTAWVASRLRGVPFVLEVRDLWPASAVQLGLLKSNVVIAVMSWMERILYDRSSKIIALTNGIRDDICGRGWSTDKVELVTCGVDRDRLYPDREGRDVVRSKFGWEGKTVVLYFGALGEANNLPVILRAAARLKGDDSILFVLIGDGMKRSETESTIADLELRNVVILPPVPKRDARIYIAAADLCLVTLRDVPLFEGAIPTKLIDYMACGKPVLCGVRGEAERIVKEAGSGEVFPPDDDARLAHLVKHILSDKSGADAMGRRGVEYVSAHFDAVTMRQRVQRILRDATAVNGRPGARH